MTIEEFYNKSQFIEDDIIAIVMYKYSHEKEFTVTREIFCLDHNCEYKHCWLNDWYEGQEDIIILRWIRKDDIEFP